MRTNGQLCSLEWVKRKRWPPSPRNPRGTLRLVDLFCGCGGLTLGAWEAARVNGFRLDVRLAVDVSDHALCVYRSNFKVDDTVAPRADISELLPGAVSSRLRAAERRLRERVGAVDALVAGPPCQGHSDLNNHTRRDDPRNGLYLRVVRAVEVFRPRLVLIENVGAVIHDKSRVVDRALTRLRRLGYAADHRLVRTDLLGLAQRRRRHILLAVADPDADIAVLFPAEDRRAGTLRDYIYDIRNEPKEYTDVYRTPAGITFPNRKRIDYLFSHRVYDLPNAQRPPCHKNGHSYKSMYGRLRWDEPAQTLTTGFGSMGQGRFVHPSRRSLLTPHEAARIQGIPDFFSFQVITRRTGVQDMIGNVVPPAISGHLLRSLITRLH